MIYETKGLSLEEVDEMYEKVDNAWQSDGFVPSFHPNHEALSRPSGVTEKVRDSTVGGQSSEETPGAGSSGVSGWDMIRGDKGEGSELRCDE